MAVPRRLYRNANIGGRLKRIQSQAPKVRDRLTSAITGLEELEAQVAQLRQRKHAISRDHQEWIEEIAESLSLSELHASQPAPYISSTKVPAIITDRYLAELSRRLNRARHKRARFIDAWARLVQEAVDVQAIFDALTSKKLEFGRARKQMSFFQRIIGLTPYARYIVHVHLVPAIRMMFAAICSFASVCIVWSELVKFAAPRLSIIRLTVVSDRKTGESEVAFGGQIFASVWILYMCAAALASFDDVKIWGNRALVRRNTYGESATWYSGQIAKLTVPLAYNFITFLPPSVHHETTFYSFLGRLINLTPLGKGFDYFFPILILVPVCATLLNLYGRVKSIFGFGLFEEEDEENSSGSGTGGWREGRALIEQELNSTSRLGSITKARGSSSPLPSSLSFSFDTDSQASHAPSLSRNPSIAATSNEQQSRLTGAEQQQAQRLAAATEAAEEEDENIFQGFAHRVRNTFENVERPEWLSELGKRPKWMGKVDGNTESSDRPDAGKGIGRWFGGRPKDGQVRL